MYILSIRCGTVRIYRIRNDLFIFILMVIDLFGMLHFQGNCVPLEAQSENHLTEYSEILHSTSLGITFEQRGVHITEQPITACESTTM